MNANLKKLLPWALVAILAVIGVLAFNQSPPARAARDDAGVSGPRHSVIDSEAHNLMTGGGSVRVDFTRPETPK